MLSAAASSIIKRLCCTVNINLLTVNLGKDISMESSSSDDTILLEELELETNSSQGNFVIFDILDWF